MRTLEERVAHTLRHVAESEADMAFEGLATRPRRPHMPPLAVSAAVAAALAAIVIPVLVVSLMRTPGGGNPPVTGQISADPTSSSTASEPSPPFGPLTLRQVERSLSGNLFRPYSGPTPPPVSQAQALALYDDSGAQSLGAVDVGFVGRDGQVTWYPVWVVGNAYYLPNSTWLSYGSAYHPDPAASPPSLDPGWVRSVALISAIDGHSVLVATL